MYSKPESKATFVHAPHDCINQVNINNLSAVYKHYNDSIKKVDPTQSIESYFWDLGPYGQSNLAEPELIVPQLGDTFDVSLTTTYGLYTHTAEYTLEIPSILEQNGYMYYYICKGDKFVYNGKEYSTPGQYVLDVVTSSTGCDSTSYLVIDYLQADVVELYDTVCYKELPYEFYGQSCNQTGAYDYTVVAKGGCDSVTYRMNLYVQEALKVELNSIAQVCSGDPTFDLSYKVIEGVPTGFSLQFADSAKTAGFVDTLGVADNNGWHTITLPQGVRPDTYMAELLIESSGCDTVRLPIAIPVLYSSDIIIQRWNDVLAVSKTAADYYNGFSTYQWYLNGLAIDGAVGSYYYCPDGLQMTGEYQVQVTRVQDGAIILSCPYIPTLHPNTSTLVVQPTAVAPAAVIQVIAPEAGDMNVVSNMGYNVVNAYLQQGQQTIVAPKASGLYFIQLTTSDGKQYVQKIIVY
jgi:hypothetical protein